MNPSTLDSLVGSDCLAPSDLMPMGTVRQLITRPLSWYWSHDFPESLAPTLKHLGFAPERLIDYHDGQRQCRAALYHKWPGQRGEDRTTLQVIGPERLEQISQLGTFQAHSLTVGPDTHSHTIRVLGSCTSAASTRLHMDLESCDVLALSQSGLGLLDIVPYRHRGQTRFATITDANAEPVHVLTGATVQELTFWLKERRLVLKRVRRYIMDGGELRLAALAHSAKIRSWSWWVDASADLLEEKVREGFGHLVDLDAYTNEKGFPRFSCILYKRS